MKIQSKSNLNMFIFDQNLTHKQHRSVVLDSIVTPTLVAIYMVSWS